MIILLQKIIKKNIDGKKNYLDKNSQDKNNEIENNKIKNIKNENTNNNPNNNNILQNFTLGKNDIITTFNQTGAFNINKDIKSEENKIDINNNTFNKTSNNNNFYFNYRNNDFNKINEGGAPLIPKTFKEPPKNTNILDNKIDINSNKYSNINNNIYLNNEKDLKYNNYLNSNDLTMRKNNLYNNKFNTLDTADINQQEKQIKLKIENEEKNINNLEAGKNPLIKEEKEEKQIVYNEITKRPNNLNNYVVDPRLNIQKENDISELLNQNNKNESQFNILNNDKNIDISQRFNNNYNNINISNNNYYKTYLKDPIRNEIMNNNNIDNINNFNYRTNNFENKNITIRSTPKRKSLSVENKQLEINDYIQTYK